MGLNHATVLLRMTRHRRRHLRKYVQLQQFLLSKYQDSIGCVENLTKMDPKIHFLFFFKHKHCTTKGVSLLLFEKHRGGALEQAVVRPGTSLIGTHSWCEIHEIGRPVE